MTQGGGPGGVGPGPGPVPVPGTSNKRLIGRIMQTGGIVQAIPEGSSSRVLPNDGEARTFFRSMAGMGSPGVGLNGMPLPQPQVLFEPNEDGTITLVYVRKPQTRGPT